MLLSEIEKELWRHVADAAAVGEQDVCEMLMTAARLVDNAYRHLHRTYGDEDE